ncbi:hypothetical protein [Xylophilus sp. ASV27]|uniref:hypothetical protein n=1 Tax=Xylophilus sp. ASV27 TaxID=2795129 RepID=UPI0018ECF4B3|nr:hypothetical protein [Xylophilus sp. ASV27]
MILAKTALGQRVLKDRSVPLAPRQRSAFILFDGKRSLADVLQATASMGVVEQDVVSMLDAGLLEHVVADQPASPAQAAAAATAEPAASRTPQQRYRDAYAVATALTAELGLRGFRLNLAVEAASGLEELRQLAPRIRDAVGEARYQSLEQALNG